MTLVRAQFLLTMVLGLLFSHSGTVLAALEEQPGHSHAAGHDHDAMQATEKKISEALATLAKVDRKQAEAQRFCPIMEHSRLGATGVPLQVMVEGKTVFVCCKECVGDAVKGGKKTLAKVEMLTKVSAVMAKMPMHARAAAEAQKYCAIANKNLLGSMGMPVTLELEGRSVFLCCKGCVGKAQANPVATLAAVEKLKKAREQEIRMHREHDHKSHEHSDHKH